MIVRCSTPSGELAVTGITCRRSGSAIRTVKLPSGRSGTGSPCSVTWACGWLTPYTISSASTANGSSCALGHRPGRAAAVAGLHRAAHRAAQTLFEQLLQLQARAALRVAAAHREDAVGVLVDVGPVLVDRIAGAGRRRGHRVAARQAVKLPAGGQVANLHAILLRRILHVDVPVVHAAVDRNFAMQRGRAVAGDVGKRAERASCRANVGPAPIGPARRSAA